MLALAPIIICLVVSAGVGARQAFVSDQGEDPTQILVRFHDGTAPSVSSRLVFANGASYNEALDVWRLDLRNDVTVEAALHALLDDPGVEFAQPNYRYQSAEAPDDPEFLRAQRAYLAAVNAEAGWSQETGSPDVTVAVLDAGVDISHSELDSKIWTNMSESLNGLDDDGNGCIDDIHGCDFLSDPPGGEIRDLTGHGTFVSGIIAAETNNGEGIAGLAWGATIMPVRILDSQGGSTTEQLAAGVLYAARNGAAVENLSLSLTPRGGSCPNDPLVDEALREAHNEHGVVIASAAGNAGIGCVSFPAASPYTIAVGGSAGPSDSDRKAFFSQWGPEIDVAAPAIGIFSTLPSNSFGVNLGTSFSTPFVAGLSALLLSQDSARTNESVKEIIRETARDVPDNGFPNWDGAGIVDAGAALGASPTFAFIDVGSSQISEIRLDLHVGLQGSIDCVATVWARSLVVGDAIHGSFGVGQCGEFWPPEPSRPWRLVGEYSGTKNAVVNAFALTSDDISCAAVDLPSIVPRESGLLATIDCAAEGQVINDTPENAVSVAAGGLPSMWSQDLQYATVTDEPSVSCAHEFSRSVWFRLNTDVTTDIAIDTFSSDFDTVLAVFDGKPNAASEIGCSDDFESRQSRLVLEADAGLEYFVMAAAFQKVPAGQLRIRFTDAFVPINDAMGNARTITPDDLHPVLQPAHSATASSSDPALSCVPSYGSSLWFKTNSESTDSLVVSTQGSRYDTVVGVFLVLNGTLLEVSCSDDVRSGDRTSRVGWEAEADIDYYIVVGSFADRSAGALRMSLTRGRP